MIFILRFLCIRIPYKLSSKVETKVEERKTQITDDRMHGLRLGNQQLKLRTFSFPLRLFNLSLRFSFD